MSLTCITKIFLESCKSGDLDQVKQCIEAGVDVNAQTDDGCNFALNYAAGLNNLKLCDLLLDHPDIDVNIRNTWLQTALMKSCSMGHVDVTKKLLQSPNIDVNHQDKYGDTSAIRAVCNNNIDCLRLLTEMKQVDWNVRDNIGFTAPMWAVSREREEVVDLLVELENIDWNIRSNNGESALTLALKNENYGILERLVTLPKLELNADYLKSQCVYNIAVRMFKTHIAEMMNVEDNNTAEKNITELVFALKNNMDNFSKLLLSTPSHVDILFLCLIFSSNDDKL